MRLGAGRVRAEDKIDPAVGIELLVQRGGEVGIGEALAIVHHQKSDEGELAVAQALKAFTIAEVPPPPVPLIIERLG